MRRGSNWQNLPHAHLQCVIAYAAATSSKEQIFKVAELWDNFKLFVSSLHLCIYSPICLNALGVPELRVRALNHNSTEFLMHSANTEDCIATYSCLTDTTGVLSRFLQQVQINARHQNLCLPYVQGPFSPSPTSMFACTFTSSSSMGSALIIRSYANSSSHGQPVPKSLDRASYTLMKRRGLRTEP